MTTLIINYSVPQEKVAQVAKHLEQTELRNSNFSGEDFKIERGEFTGFADDALDDNNYSVLLDQIQHIISWNFYS